MSGPTAAVAAAAVVHRWQGDRGGLLWGGGGEGEGARVGMACVGAVADVGCQRRPGEMIEEGFGSNVAYRCEVGRAVAEARQKREVDVRKVARAKV